MTFRVGQRVVCVSDEPDFMGRPIFVKKGEIYTIAAVMERFGSIGVLLAEIDPGRAPGWMASRFRPIVERKTSIEVFQRMLNPSEVEA